MRCAACDNSFKPDFKQRFGSKLHSFDKVCLDCLAPVYDSVVDPQHSKCSDVIVELLEDAGFKIDNISDKGVTCQTNTQ